MRVLWRVKTYEAEKLKNPLSDKFGDHYCTKSEENAHRRFE